MDKKIFGLNPFPMIIIKERIKEFCQKKKINFLPFTNKNYKKIAEILSKKYELFDWRDEEDFKEFFNGLKTKGRPDYFLWKNINGKMRFWLVEYKSLHDFLQESQTKWFMKYHKLPILLMKSLQKGEINCVKRKEIK